MDKYEFNIKVEQIRKLVNKGDYETAMKITDTIDWRKVRNANLLSMVAEVYEKNKEYQEAKDILLLAFERAPIGKRLLYKLTELALKEGNTDEAEAYYREFCELAGDDPRQDLLRYKILKQKDAPVEQLIHSLENYTSEELDEKWLYELADLYHLAGDADRCVSTCDKIMLMFGLGKYVDKAMELKLQYAPLTTYQMDLVENRDKYEAKLRAVEQSFSEEGGAEEDFADTDTEELSVTEDVEDAAEADVPETASAAEIVAEPEEPAGEGISTEAVYPSEEPAGAAEPVVQPDVYAKDDIAAAVRQAEVEEKLAKEMSRLSVDSQPEEESELGKTRVLHVIRHAQPEEITAVEEPAAEAVVEETEDEPELPKMTNHLMIEARTPEKGLEMAIQTLKQIQKETGIKNPVAKITGSKLNKRGVLASAEKLAGTDLMIEEAGDLSAQMLKELEQLMAQDTSGMRIILIDNPKQMEMLHGQNPSLASRFECIGSGEHHEAGEAASPVQEKSAPESMQTVQSAQPEQASPQDDRPVRQITPNRDLVTRVPDEADRYADEHPDDDVEYEDDYEEPGEADGDMDAEEEMDIDEFAQYACQYASEIDCSITGKSMLALYERIEIMEEEGIPLTRTSAEDLIEEAADRAEKPSVGRMIKGLFSSKYDKDGLLILKEEHFI
ncbi:MAG: hypothetical protein Q4F28_14220 [Eubacteriales bacterium]|nr:hypothetical protein [Eubacteriales bacterium]